MVVAAPWLCALRTRREPPEFARWSSRRAVVPLCRGPRLRTARDGRRTASLKRGSAATRRRRRGAPPALRGSAGSTFLGALAAAATRRWIDGRASCGGGRLALVCCARFKGGRAGRGARRRWARPGAGGRVPFNDWMDALPDARAVAACRFMERCGSGAASSKDAVEARRVPLVERPYATALARGARERASLTPATAAPALLGGRRARVAWCRASAAARRRTRRASTRRGAACFGGRSRRGGRRSRAFLVEEDLAARSSWTATPV